MDKFWWHAAWGLCLLPLSLAQQQIDLNITCRYAGVFHVEKNGRYSISRTEAADLCQAFNSTLPTMDQMVMALSKGFETCRYGFIEGHVVIPRIQPNAICAANHTGVYILTSNTSHYDTYCFNASAPLEEDCTSVTDLPNSFEGPVTITIVNRDGTRYSKKGEYRTHQEDIDASNTTDDDVSSGSSSEKSTSGGYVFHTYLPTIHSTADQDDPYFIGSTMATTRSGGKDGRRGGGLPKDATTSLEGYTTHYPETMENGTLTPVTPAKTGVFGETEVTVAEDSNFNVDGSLPGDQDSSMDPRGNSLTVTDGSKLTGHSSGNQDSGANTTSRPGRKPQIPEWLIVLASLLALALILAVCIAVNSRRRCGQKKKLVINSGNGKVEDRKPSELNGEASKSQEMVHLVNKEPSETPDQFMTADETRNLQNVDMKIGV
uniref:CD44 antigen n=2 Tax=Mesocricetus auratus TaxID=10036 RepID=CD44_MESAU|nr:RecName: Full=CD44 antigen; AltName: Full=Extracellular matrix receptor III; Short=ECMR-III; AltName: Full=GP90 lymphocyte homing/adhesion receptor; AltName: Full=HAM1 antigen; AltName: Full=HUTCH-I; AltName: Full=Heparan sulfate proteoglycan; AltName: Full=Hermes antigen; AltName: Full=Hyaluronate receptor; AltName: Full=Phagocytic glycoprotein 1; Short=PGP-1; AltName: Full=Phagocytic glycoprotein I; Short=PGP-I; AltName: CD_antigen=CD44; Flags: Precursor [Mesocricetus auratus]AAC13767.1 HAM1 